MERERELIIKWLYDGESNRRKEAKVNIKMANVKNDAIIVFARNVVLITFRKGEDRCE